MLRGPIVSRSLWRWALFAAITALMLFGVPTPLAVYEPGIAFNAAAMVKTAKTDRSGSGSFFMTTVKLEPATFWTAIRSSWDGDLQLFTKKSLLQGMSQAEYKKAQLVIMRASESDAVEAAYRTAGIRYRSEPDGVGVGSAGDGGTLQPGDVITAASGVRLDGIPALYEAIGRAARTSGALELSVIRSGSALELTVNVQRQGAVPAASGGQEPDAAAKQPKSAGARALLASSGSDALRAAKALGVAQLVELRRIVPDDPDKAVAIDAEDIGGPSAGLMFALQAADELTAGDLTGGFIVAGTGTIEPDGAVGPIGGASHKAAAAAKVGAQLFLVPRKNAEEARRKAEQLGSGMLVEPVDTLDEAIQAIRRAAGKRDR